jgi:hypothetical protein
MAQDRIYFFALSVVLFVSVPMKNNKRKPMVLQHTRQCYKNHKEIKLIYAQDWMKEYAYIM